MPPKLLFDISGIDLGRVLHGPEAIRAANPQRGAMEHLDAVVHIAPEAGEIVGYKNVRDDEFWVPGHIPGRPLLPGVIMIEAAAQLASFYTRIVHKWVGFIGFGGVDAVRFRTPVTPGQRMHILLKQIWNRHGRLCCNAQGIVDGNLAFEGQVIGTVVPG